jgi:hypothetical protein
MDKLTQIREGQKTKGQKAFSDKFAEDTVVDVGGHNSFLLTSVGCFKRHDIERKEMYLTDQENKTRNFDYLNKAEREERQIQIDLQKLFALGYKLLLDESAEDFITRCKEEECINS